MNKITRLTAGRSREKRINIYIDGSFRLSLLAEVARNEGLHIGQDLSDMQIAKLSEADRLQRCLNAAIRYLGVRPRSEAEIRQRLRQHGYDPDCTEKALARLKERRLVDDTAFARFWTENRESFSPRSRRMTALELKRKGLNTDTIEEVTGGVDDSDSAYRAAVQKARRLAPSDYQEFRRRLGEYLRRRGFFYDVINQTIDRLWKEHEQNL